MDDHVGAAEERRKIRRADVRFLPFEPGELQAAGPSGNADHLLNPLVRAQSPDDASTHVPCGAEYDDPHARALPRRTTCKTPASAWHGLAADRREHLARVITGELVRGQKHVRRSDLVRLCGAAHRLAAAEA